MKKIAIAVAAAMTAATASAMDFTLYGIVDTGLGYTHVNTLNEPTENRFEEINGYNSGSRFGFKGTEDLGNGYSVSFVLENGFSSDSGALGQGGRMFGREAQLFINGSFGELSFGRVGQLTSGNGTYGIAGSMTPFGTSWGGAIESSYYMVGFQRFDNTVTYKSPTFAGTTDDATVGATYEINGEGSVIFSNGTIEFTAFNEDQNTFAFKANTAGLVFDNITATVKGGATFAGFGSAGEEAVGTMTIKDSKITTEGYFVVSTNASKSASSNVVINIIDSTLTSVQPDNDSVGIMFNVPGELNVSRSSVTADSQGMIIRGGNVKATIKDTEVTITGDCSEANVEGYGKYESADWASGNGVPMGAFVIGDRSTSYEVGLSTVVLEEVTIKAPDDVNKVYVYAQEGDTTVDLTITNCGLEAADIVGSKVTDNVDVYKLTIDGAQVLPAPVVDEGNTEEAQG